MAQIGYPLIQKSPPSSGGLWLARNWKKKTINQKWPRPRNSTQSKQQQQTVDWFTRAVEQWKHEPPLVRGYDQYLGHLYHMLARDIWMSIIAGWYGFEATDKHGRQYPSKYAALLSDTLDVVCPGWGGLLVRYESGWWSMAAGRSGDRMIMTDTGPGWSSSIGKAEGLMDTKAAREISEALDAIGREPGSIAYRAADRWHGLPPGEKGDILSLDENRTPVWRQPSNVE